MKLFENGVGRPSNEIKQKRRNFIASIVIIVGLLVIAGIYAFDNLTLTNLKGASNDFSIKCPAKVAVNQEFMCKSEKAEQIRVAPVGNLAKGYDSKVKLSSKDGYNAAFKFSKKGTVYVEAKKNGKTKKTKVIVEDRLYMYCYQTTGDYTFVCKANQSGVKITVGGAKSLEKGCSSSFTTTSKDLSKTIRYNQKLFTDYKNLIKKDKDGRQYIDATVKASKKGYKTVNGKIRVYNLNTILKLDCPKYASTNENFLCSTNQSGVKITIGGAKSLASGYTSSFTTTEKDKSKSIKYDTKLFTDYKNLIKKTTDGGKYIPVTITAAKAGYKTITKKVDIHLVTKIPISCPNRVTIFDEFKCTTTWEGVTITVGGANSLARGYTPSFTTTEKDKTKSIKFDNILFTNYKNLIKKESNGRQYLPITVTASKPGFDSVKTTIKMGVPQG